MDRRGVLRAVMSLAQRCDYEAGHSQQVCRLALNLFDELAGQLGLGDADRFLLKCGALLHDIGWVAGQKKHHKTAMRLILEAKDLPLECRDRRIVALVSRYHRKKLPEVGDAVYCDMTRFDQGLVDKLAGILRVADGLDRRHLDVVERIECRVDQERLVVLCRAASSAEAELAAGAKKSDLLSQVVGRPVVITVEP